MLNSRGEMIMGAKCTVFAHKHIYMFSIILTALTMEAKLILTKVLILEGEQPETLIYGVAEIITLLIPTLLICIAAILISMKDKLVPSKTNFGQGLLLGLPMILIGVYAGINSIVDIGITELSNPGALKIITFVISTLFIGIQEEFLCRGVLLNLMMEKWGRTRKGMIKSVFLSSVIFGLLHLAILVVYPGLVISATAQVLYASFVGVYFACIYIRCKNLYSVVLLHAFFDACVLLINILYLPAALEVIRPTESTLADGLGSVVIWFPFVFIGLFLIRKKKMSVEHTE